MDASDHGDSWGDAFTTLYQDRRRRNLGRRYRARAQPPSPGAIAARAARLVAARERVEARFVAA